MLCLAAAAAAAPLDNDSIKTAVAAWLSDSAAAEVTYGHISAWDTSQVTSMRDLFCADPAYPTACDPARASFNDDISAWDTSGVTDMHGMFRYCSSFNQAIGGWLVFGGCGSAVLAAAFGGTESNLGIGFVGVCQFLFLGCLFLRGGDQFHHRRWFFVDDVHVHLFQ